MDVYLVEVRRKESRIELWCEDSNAVGMRW